MRNEDAREEGQEPYAELHFLPMWAFKLGPRDALLVLKALGGRLTSPEDVDAANKLGDRLTALRIQASEQHAVTAGYTRMKLEEATGKTVEQIIKDR